MTMPIDTRDVCCVALELSKTSWVCAFAVPGDGKAILHKIKAGEVDRLIGFLESCKAKATQQLCRPLEIVLCYEVGYDGMGAKLTQRTGRRAGVFVVAAARPGRGAGGRGCRGWPRGLASRAGRR